MRTLFSFPLFSERCPAVKIVRQTQLETRSCAHLRFHKVIAEYDYLLHNLSEICIKIAASALARERNLPEQIETLAFVIDSSQL